MSANEKRVWPELVGKDADAAIKILKEESGLDNIPIVRDNSAITLDHCPTRIRVFVNEKNIVTVDPRLG